MFLKNMCESDASIYGLINVGKYLRKMHVPRFYNFHNKDYMCLDKDYSYNKYRMALYL